MNKITPFLWFETQAEDAMNFYCSVFKNSKVHSVSRQGPNGPVMSVTFELEGQMFMGLNAGPEFKFNEAVSFFVGCKDQTEVDYYWNKLTADGGEEGRCGWCKDKFGLSWQIIPDVLGSLIGGPDAEKANRALQAMLTMNKLDVKALQSAYDGA